MDRPINDILSDIEGRVDVGKLVVWGLSGAGFALRIDDDVIYVDPYLIDPGSSEEFRRMNPVPFSPDRVRKAKAVLSTHEHEDHCNLETLRGLRDHTDALFIGPSSSTKKAISGGYPSSRVVTLSPGRSHEISPSFRATAFGSRDPYEPSAIMFLIETPRANIVHSGDTLYFEGFAKIGASQRVDIAMLNFGKQIPTPEKPYYMNAKSLAEAARDLKAKTVIPMHWNMWIEAMEDPRTIGPILKTISPSSRLEILEMGQKIVV